MYRSGTALLIKLRHCLIRLIAIEEVRNSRKIVCIKNIFENGWWEDAYPSSYTLYTYVNTPDSLLESQVHSRGLLTR